MQWFWNRAGEAGRSAMLILLGWVLGNATGNALPDPTDFVAFNAVANGTIVNPYIFINVYYVYPGLFWVSVFLFLLLGFQFKFVTPRIAVWIVSAIIIGSTLMIMGTVSPLLLGDAIYFDVFLSVGCVFAVLQVEGKLNWKSFTGMFSWVRSKI